MSEHQSPVKEWMEWIEKFKNDEIAYPPTWDAKKIVKFLKMTNGLRTDIAVNCWTEDIGSNGIVYVTYARCEGYRGDRLLFTTAVVLTSGDIGVIGVERWGRKPINAPSSFIDMYSAIFIPGDTKKSEAIYRLLHIEDGIAIYKLEKYKAIDYDGKVYTKPPCCLKTVFIIIAPYATYVVRIYRHITDSKYSIVIAKARGRLNEIAHLLFMPKLRRIA